MHFVERLIIDCDWKFTQIVLNSAIINKTSWDQVMAWLWAGDKPLPEPMFSRPVKNLWW